MVQRKGQQALVIVSGWLNSRMLPPRPPRRCPLKARTGQYHGYRIEWTYKDGLDAYDRLCERPAATFVLASAILQGEGKKRFGEALGRELQPHLAPLVEATWSRACDGSVAIILRGDTRDCQLDPVNEAIGEFLRERDASDRIIVSRGLRAAPAL